MQHGLLAAGDGLDEPGWLRPGRDCGEAFVGGVGLVFTGQVGLACGQFGTAGDERLCFLNAAEVEEGVGEGQEGDGAFGVVGQPGLFGQFEDGPAVGFGVVGTSVQAVDLGQMATGDDVHDRHGPVGGDEVERGTEGFPGFVELAGGHPAAADDEEQTGARPRLVAWDQVEGGFGGAQRVVGVTEGDEPARFEQGQLRFHERSLDPVRNSDSVSRKASTSSWTSSQRPAWWATQAAARVRRRCRRSTSPGSSWIHSRKVSSRPCPTRIHRSRSMSSAPRSGSPAAM